MNFGKRDLGLVLSETIGDADTLRFTKDSRWVFVHKQASSGPRALRTHLLHRNLERLKSNSPPVAAILQYGADYISCCISNIVVSIISVIVFDRKRKVVSCRLVFVAAFFGALHA